jgi:hypothetical protein
MVEVPADQRVRILAEALSADGYAAAASHATSGGEQLCQHHCPVAHVAAEFPQLCEAETEAFARLLGTPVQRLATIAHGDGVCTTHVSPRALASRQGRPGPAARPAAFDHDIIPPGATPGAGSDSPGATPDLDTSTETSKETAR